MAETKTRNQYLDIMKGLLITLVVIGHLPFFEYDSRTLTLIYSFHMHAFVIIGGLLSHVNENTKISTIIFKRLKGSLVPYFIYYIITFLIIPTTPDRRIKALLVVIKGIGIPPDDALSLPLWFLTYYFVVMTLYEVIQYVAFKLGKQIQSYSFSTQSQTKTLKNNDDKLNKSAQKNNNYVIKLSYIVHVITFIIIIIIMFFSFRYARIYKLQRLPYNIEIAGFSLGFVFLGNVICKKFLQYIKSSCPYRIIAENNHFNNSSEITTLKNKNNISREILKLFSIVLILLIIFIVWYKLSMKNGRIDLNARDYKKAHLMYINALLGFILLSAFTYSVTIMPLVKTFIAKLTQNNILLTMSDFISNISAYINKLFSYLGKNSIYILAFHIPSTYYRNAFIIPFLPANIQQMLFQNSPLSIFILTTYGILFSLAFAHILNSIKNLIIKRIHI